MMVQPELLDHPKYRRLKRRVGDKAAEILLRLWAHCQGNQRGEFWPKKTGGYVEDIAGWEGEPGKLAEILGEPYDNEPGWITIDGEGVRINGWNEHNQRLVVNWTANPSGKSKGKAQDTLKGSHHHPLRSPDKIREDKRGEEGTRAGDASLPNSEKKEAAPEPHIPSLAEVIDAGQMPDVGAPEAYCKHFFDKHEDGSTSWLDGHGNLRPWRRRLKTWWEKDRGRPEWKKPAVKKSREDVADLEAQLQLAKDPTEIEGIRRQLEAARA